MICYKDKCFCAASNTHFKKELNIKVCKNKRCNKHKCNIPFDKVPEWMPIAWADYHERCEEYKE